ncbi:energy transducer TonB [Pseudomonas sp. HMWF032]|uniref:energy transducer TonB family protein n=1 Tax=Pseudomonas sp. HMWF032 TaxID=2056866 RepID=UPI000D3BF500|nr:energy transducer TonB [Pseudomonas sp. HMWF032]PTS84897.1 energy transducer TonB [Pseudomonas sp. HMWF032]PTT82224.1 energy transducer TonB [Pseudomonas sp. HMWF010]
MTRSHRSLFWMASLLLVVTLHVALFIWALYWHPQAIAVEPPPAAMLVELQPLVAAPKPTPPVIQQPEPEPEPQPKLIEAPKPKLAVAQPKPKPKPRPPQPKPQPKPVETPTPETAQASNDAAPAAQQQAAPRQSAPSEDHQARTLWLSKVHAHLSSRLHYPDRERRFNRIGHIQAVTLTFDVNGRGDILLGKIKASTARPSFDRDVLIQLRKASPVPRPPQEVLSSGSISLDFPIKFELTR